MKRSVNQKSKRRSREFYKTLEARQNKSLWRPTFFALRTKINRPILRVALLPRSISPVPRVPLLSLPLLSPPLSESLPSSPFNYQIGLNSSPLRLSYSPIPFPLPVEAEQTIFFLEFIPLPPPQSLTLGDSQKLNPPVDPCVEFNSASSPSLPCRVNVSTKFPPSLHILGPTEYHIGPAQFDLD